MTERFDEAIGFRLADAVEECRLRARVIADSSEGMLARRADVEAARCRRAWWRMRGAGAELAEELAYCRVAIQRLRRADSAAGAALMERLSDEGDTLLELY